MAGVDDLVVYVESRKMAGVDDMAVSRLFRYRGFIPGPLCKRGPMGPKGRMGPMGPKGPWGSTGPMGPMGPVYVAFT